MQISVSIFDVFLKQNIHFCYSQRDLQFKTVADTRVTCLRREFKSICLNGISFSAMVSMIRLKERSTASVSLPNFLCIQWMHA